MMVPGGISQVTVRFMLFVEGASLFSGLLLQVFISINGMSSNSIYPQDADAASVCFPASPTPVFRAVDFFQPASLPTALMLGSACEKHLSPWVASSLLQPLTCHLLLVSSSKGPQVPCYSEPQRTTLSRWVFLHRGVSQLLSVWHREGRNLMKGEPDPHLKQLLTSLGDKPARPKSSS